MKKSANRSRRPVRSSTSTKRSCRLFVPIVIACLACLLAGTTPLYACQYTVREVGFVDLDNPPYQIYGVYPGGEAAESFRTAFLAACAATLVDANVKSQLLVAGKNADHPAVELATAKAGADGSAVVIRSPNDHWLVLPINAEAKAVQQDVWNAVESVVTSPVRDKVLDELIEAYAVILVVEGEDARANERVHKSADGAIATWQQLRPRLPKSVEVGPRIITISRDDLPKERVFVWSLGMDIDKSTEPWAAVMFARGKLVGESLEGWLVTQDDLYRNLAVVGQDCECNLDRKWMRGKMVPLVWDEKRQAKVVEKVGFDAENPMIQSEMARILSRGPNGQAPVGLAAAGPDSDDDLLLGYVETPITVESDTDAQSDTVPQADSTPATDSSTTTTDTDDQPSLAMSAVEGMTPSPYQTTAAATATNTSADGPTASLAEAEPTWKPLVWTFAALTLIIIASAAIMVIRSRRQAA